jgi:hypothetical protein
VEKETKEKETKGKQKLTTYNSALLPSPNSALSSQPYYSTSSLPTKTPHRLVPSLAVLWARSVFLLDSTYDRSAVTIPVEDHNFAIKYHRGPKVLKRGKGRKQHELAMAAAGSHPLDKGFLISAPTAESTPLD